MKVYTYTMCSFNVLNQRNFLNTFGVFFSSLLSFSSFLILNQTRLLQKIYFFSWEILFHTPSNLFLRFTLYFLFVLLIFLALKYLFGSLLWPLYFLLDFFLWITFLSYLCPFSCVPTRTTVILVWESSLKLNFFNGFLKSIFWMRCFTLVWSRHTNSILY